MRDKLWMSWSSGKDAAFALSRLREDPGVDVVGLFTTVNERFGRVAMHGVRRELLEAQAQALGLPLHVAELPDGCSNEDYLARTRPYLERAKSEGVTAVAFGDLHLEDVRAYREVQVASVGLQARFPLFGADTAALAREMIAAGLQATLCCIDTEALPKGLLGRPYDEDLLRDLPATADACGEFGEFHSFAHRWPGGGLASAPKLGQVVDRGRFHFVELTPA